MANVIFAYPNVVDVRAGQATPTFSGGNWQTPLPLPNLADPELINLTRSVNAAASSTRFIVDLKALFKIKCIALPKHNMSTSAKIAISVFTDNDLLTPIVSVQDDVFPEIYTFGSLAFGDSGWFDLRLAQSEIGSINYGYHHVFQDGIYGQFVTIDIVDEQNPNGFIDLARLVIASGWQPSTNVDWDHAFGVQSESRAFRAISGQSYFDRRPNRRNFRANLSTVPVNEILANGFDMLLQADIVEQIYFIFDPDDTVHRHRRSFLARIRRPANVVTFPFFGRGAMPIDLEEVL